MKPVIFILLWTHISGVELKSRALFHPFEVTHSLGVLQTANDDNRADYELKTVLDEQKEPVQIKFFTINCRSGEMCSSIVPSQEKTKTPLKKDQTDPQLKDYLTKLGLLSGFSYSGDPVIDSHNVASRHMNRINKQLGAQREARKLQFDKFSDYEDLFPGSYLRPEILLAEPRHVSQFRETRDHRPTSQDKSIWEKLSLERGYYPIAESRQLPLFDVPLEWPYDTRMSANPVNRRKKQVEGHWGRYGTSTVTQLDKNSGKWVPVSSGDTRIDEKDDAFYSEQPIYKPNKSIHHTGAALTVLGFDDNKSSMISANPSKNKPYLLNMPNWSTIFNDVKVTGGQIYNKKPFPVSRPVSTGHSVTTSSHVSLPVLVLPLTVSQPFENTRADTDNLITTTTATADPTIATETTTAEITTTVIPPTSSTTLASADSSGVLSGLTSNHYAVMAAVGAGLIPATFAALLPVFVGKRRKRRRRWTTDRQDLYKTLISKFKQDKFLDFTDKQYRPQR